MHVFIFSKFKTTHWKINVRQKKAIQFVTTAATKLKAQFFPVGDTHPFCRWLNTTVLIKNRKRARFLDVSPFSLTFSTWKPIAGQVRSVRIREARVPFGKRRHMRWKSESFLRNTGVRGGGHRCRYLTAFDEKSIWPRPNHSIRLRETEALATGDGVSERVYRSVTKTNGTVNFGRENRTLPVRYAENGPLLFRLSRSLRPTVTPRREWLPFMEERPDFVGRVVRGSQMEWSKGSRNFNGFANFRKLFNFLRHTTRVDKL